MNWIEPPSGSGNLGQQQGYLRSEVIDIGDINVHSAEGRALSMVGFDESAFLVSYSINPQQDNEGFVIALLSHTDNISKPIMLFKTIYHRTVSSTRTHLVPPKLTRINDTTAILCWEIYTGSAYAFRAVVIKRFGNNLLIGPENSIQPADSSISNPADHSVVVLNDTELLFMYKATTPGFGGSLFVHRVFINGITFTSSAKIAIYASAHNLNDNIRTIYDHIFLNGYLVVALHLGRDRLETSSRCDIFVYDISGSTFNLIFNERLLEGFPGTSGGNARNPVLVRYAEDKAGFVWLSYWNTQASLRNFARTLTVDENGQASFGPMEELAGGGGGWSSGGATIKEYASVDSPPPYSSLIWGGVRGGPQAMPTRPRVSRLYPLAWKYNPENDISESWTDGDYNYSFGAFNDVTIHSTGHPVAETVDYRHAILVFVRDLISLGQDKMVVSCITTQRREIVSSPIDIPDLLIPRKTWPKELMPRLRYYLRIYGVPEETQKVVLEELGEGIEQHVLDEYAIYREMENWVKELQRLNDQEN